MMNAKPPTRMGYMSSKSCHCWHAVDTPSSWEFWVSWIGLGSMTLEQRPKGMIKCLCCMGLCTTRPQFLLTLVGLRQSYSALTQRKLPKAFPAGNCVRGHLGHVERNAYRWAYNMHLSSKCVQQSTTPRVLLTPDTWQEVLDPAQFHPAGTRRFTAIPDCVCRCFRLQPSICHTTSYLSDISGANGN